MGKVILDMAMSLDGFINGPNDSDGGLYNWYFAPPSEATKGSQMVIEESITNTGAIVMGRRTYDTGDRQDGFADTPYKCTHYVLTHHPPEKPAKGSTIFVFVTDGIESALRQAKKAAGDRDIAIGGGANVAQQTLSAGLVNKIQIHLVPVLLGDGVHLFDHLGAEAVELEMTRVIDAPGVTHLQYRVIR